MIIIKLKRYFKKKFIALAFATLIMGSPQAPNAGALNNLCTKLFKPFTQNQNPNKTNREINDIEQLLISFSKGLEINPNNIDHRAAFDLYRSIKFGDPLTVLNSNTWEELSKSYKKYPNIQKEPFRNYTLETMESQYPITPELKKFLSSQLQSIGQVKSNLFQIDANTGYWKKVLQYDGKKEDFINFLNQRIPKDLRDKIINSEIVLSERAKILFTFLKNERTVLQKLGKDIRPISQAIVDLFHTIGFHDPKTIEALKNPDGIVGLEAYRHALSERDKFALKLGFDNHFDQVLNDFQVLMPTGLESNKTLPEKLRSLEDDLLKNFIIKSLSISKTVRHLSLIESPFRSCLGGSDCSSRTYLTRALDPNYHYFTLTDDSGNSSGNITIVLGKAQTKAKKEVKVAFIDKVQNVSNVDLPLMIEAVRRSVAEKDYILTLTDEMGDHNGISNTDETRLFLEKMIPTDSKTEFVKFKPHPNSLKLQDMHSRVNKNLTSRAISPIVKSGIYEHSTLTPESIDEPWHSNTLNLENIIQATYDLKKGTSDDHLKYITSMKAIESFKLKIDPEFNTIIYQWLKNPKEPFQVRKQIVIYEWLEKSKPLLSLLSYFNKNDQIQIIQNLLDTPRYKKILLDQKKQLHDLILITRENIKLRNFLMNDFIWNKRSLLQPIIERILDDQNISDQKASDLIHKIKSGLGTLNPSEIIEAQNMAQDTPIEDWIKNSLLQAYISSFNSDLNLAKAIVQCLKSKESSIRTFGLKLLEFSNHPAVITKSSLRDLESFVQSETKKNIENSTFLSLFKKLSSKRKLNQKKQKIMDLFEDSKMESFEFQPFSFPKDGITTKLGTAKDSNFFSDNERSYNVTFKQAFEMQSTPVTQLQWALMMNENPSYFKKNGKLVQLRKGLPTKINPNRPVENVSWEDIDRFIHKLNEYDPNYHYRLPTEAEWEYAAQAGTDTAYSFGDDIDQIQNYGWNSFNSQNETHDVASLLQNSYGLYDMHGNVSEWAQDWYTRSHPEFEVDPSGPSTGTFRVIRGGSWKHHPKELRSAHRSYNRPRSGNNSLGFRLVRVPLLKNTPEN